MTEDFENNVSVVILSYNQVDTTVKCVDHVVASVGPWVREILVVDNGSPAGVVDQLAFAVAGRARLVAVGTNRYFGEGNNIGVEEATGRYVLLLNNDAYVDQSCIDELVGTMTRRPELSAVGPMFLYPSGLVQEVGGLVLPTGDVVQIGKGAFWPPEHYTEEFVVDYCSAACLLLRRCDFLTAGGFAIEWEPAYYEDVDLCLTLRTRVGPVVVNPKARVVHLESLTTGDAKMRLESQVEINRLSFVEKWGAWLHARQGHNPPAPSAIPVTPPTGPARASRPTRPRQSRVRSAALYTPYEIIPGGGERVLFELAAVLAEAVGASNVRFVAPHRYSFLRIGQMKGIFDLDGPDGCITLGEIESDPPELGVTLGNEVVPPTPGMGTRFNVYLCQFPFDVPEDYIHAKSANLSTFDEIWVYSNFVKRYVNGHLSRLGLRAPAIRVMYPPATLPGAPEPPVWKERTAVMTVGRFFKGGHNKRQDIVIEIVRQLGERFGRTPELLVAGALHATSASRDRFRELVSMAGDLNCHFYPNVGRSTLMDLYARSAVLIHATGYEVDPLDFPERLEHFGIVPVEAASFGCIPVVYQAGGLTEVMEMLGCPTTFRSIPEGVERINGLFADPDGAGRLSRELIHRSEMFSRNAYRDRVYEALAEVL